MDMTWEELVVPHNKPLCINDTAVKTFGCRHSNPNTCGSNCLENVCAFVRGSHICLKPPRSWKKYFGRLAKQRSKA